MVWLLQQGNARWVGRRWILPCFVCFGRVVVVLVFDLFRQRDPFGRFSLNGDDMSAGGVDLIDDIAV